MIRVIENTESDYPEKLKVYKGMPKSIYVRGTVPGKEEKTVGIVGARMCSQYGKQQAYRFGYELAKAGVSVISGMALGIDSCAHGGALAAEGRTYAVLGCGADICYPRRNRRIYEEIQKKGGILSEFANGTPPIAMNFPRRNRIISALSDVVLVIEAKSRSGSLITADFALEQGKEIFALPGRTGDSLSEGTNSLIAQGAGVATDPEVILQVLGIDRSEGRIETEKKRRGLATEINLVYSCVDLQPKDLQTILEEVSLPVSRTIEILLKLQLDGEIIEVFRNCYVRNINRTESR